MYTVYRKTLSIKKTFPGNERSMDKNRQPDPSRRLPPGSHMERKAVFLLDKDSLYRIPLPRMDADGLPETGRLS